MIRCTSSSSTSRKAGRASSQARLLPSYSAESAAPEKSALVVAEFVERHGMREKQLALKQLIEYVWWRTGRQGWRRAH